MTNDVKNSYALKVGGKIRKLRHEKQLTVEKLAEIVGVSDGYMRQIEVGRNLPSLTVLYDIREYFNVGFDYFFFNNEANPSRQEVLNTISLLLNSFDDTELPKIEKHIRNLKDLFF